MCCEPSHEANPSNISLPFIGPAAIVPLTCSQNPASSSFISSLLDVFISGPIGPACCCPLQFQVPTNHFSTLISAGGTGIAGGLSSAAAANAHNAISVISFVMCSPSSQYVVFVLPCGDHLVCYALDLL